MGQGYGYSIASKYNSHPVICNNILIGKERWEAAPYTVGIRGSARIISNNLITGYGFGIEGGGRIENNIITECTEGGIRGGRNHYQ